MNVAQGGLDNTVGGAADIVFGRIESAGLWNIPGEQAGQRQRPHLISTEPFPLSSSQLDQLQRLGDALLGFYSAVNDLYIRGGIDWFNEYLNIGKGEELIRHALMKNQRRALPGIIRPDVLITDEGFRITELDSVPGGFGHLDCLSAAYSEGGFDVIGGGRGIRDGFVGLIRDISSDSNPVVAIVVSDESKDYMHEMTYLAGELRDIGLRAFAVKPAEIAFTEQGLYIETPDGRLKIDVAYRFFELFDLLNIPKAELISYAARKRLVTVTPPYKPFLEEKMLLALFRHPALEQHWRKALGERYDLLDETLTNTYIMDNRPVPPSAQICGFRWRNEPIRDWKAIKDGSQKQRRLVIKPSGFSPMAWGSRGVKIGHDMSGENWAQAVDEALESFDFSPWVLQYYRDTSIIGVKYCNKPGGEVLEMRARVRLCPYYFVADGRANLGGVLATACPQDKKLIHGMADAVLAPCRLEED
ncbi:MAG: hypothetical protein GX139_01950 [Armatimonadetes bacterium]|nr:hypothetical protein [Armatimonadota bacterium]